MSSKLIFLTPVLIQCLFVLKTVIVLVWFSMILLLSLGMFCSNFGGEASLHRKTLFKYKIHFQCFGGFGGWMAAGSPDNNAVCYPGFWFCFHFFYSLIIFLFGVGGNFRIFKHCSLCTYSLVWLFRASHILSTPVKCLSTSFQFLPAWWMQCFRVAWKRHCVCWY